MWREEGRERPLISASWKHPKAIKGRISSSWFLLATVEHPGSKPKRFLFCFGARGHFFFLAPADPEEKNINSDLSYIHQSISLGPRVSQCFPQILQCVYLHLLTLGPSCVRWPVSDERQFLGLPSVLLTLKIKAVNFICFSFPWCSVLFT